MDPFARLTVIGYGTMGRAILLAAAGSGDAGGVLASQIAVAEPDPSHQASARAHGFLATPSAAQAAALTTTDGLILLAVKPQSFSEVAPQIAAGCQGKLVVSVMAGVSTQRLHQSLGQACRVVRVMPNLALMTGASESALCAGPGATPEDLARVESLFATMGRTHRLREELFDAFTAVASSGLAYVYYLAEAMTRGAVASGFDQPTAESIVRGTIIGAASLLESPPSGGSHSAGQPPSPSELRRRVTSKGGTTAAATEVLDSSGVMKIVERAVLAATHRGAQLSQLAGSPPVANT